MFKVIVFRSNGDTRNFFSLFLAYTETLIKVDDSSSKSVHINVDFDWVVLEVEIDRLVGLQPGATWTWRPPAIRGCYCRSSWRPQQCSRGCLG